MKRFRCSFCSDGQPLGYLFDDPTLAICGRCRDSSLSFIKDAGVFMSMEHVFIAELCESASVFGDQLKFFDYANPNKPGRVLPVIKMWGDSTTKVTERT